MLKLHSDHQIQICWHSCGPAGARNELLLAKGGHQTTENLTWTTVGKVELAIKYEIQELMLVK